MKRIFILFYLIDFLIILSCTQAYAQTKLMPTEGRAFWIALTKAKTTGSNDYTPYITVSATKACTIMLINPNTNWPGIVKEIPAGLTTIESSEIPQAQWVNTSFNTSDFQVAQPLGLQLTSTENVSVYVASRMEYSFDATNVLPTTALTGEYMIQDYPACDHEDKADQNSATFVVVATQNNTHISIVPTHKTRNDNAAGSAFTATLNRGEVYHVITEDVKGSSFTGTRVTADQPIAVFAGDVNTDVPGEATARDLLYEVQVPTEFWGTEFVVTRTMDRDADRVRITALNDGTEIYINGIKKAVINSVQTYEIELSEGDIDQSALNKMFTVYDQLISGADAHYIKTTQPVAIYLYMVGRKYKRKDSTYDMGDPSMVWISPLEQKIKETTFNEFATNITEDHYVNIITETDNIESIQLFQPDLGKQNFLTTSDFQPVLGNPNYSYARIKIDHSNISRPVSKEFTIKGNKGFIAHVYGNGTGESYAFSVSSGVSPIEISKYLENDTTYTISWPAIPNTSEYHILILDSAKVDTIGEFWIDSLGENITPAAPNTEVAIMRKPKDGSQDLFKLKLKVGNGSNSGTPTSAQAAEMPNGQRKLLTNGETYNCNISGTDAEGKTTIDINSDFTVQSQETPDGLINVPHTTHPTTHKEMRDGQILIITPNAKYDLNGRKTE